MKGAINELGNKIPTSEVICEIHLSPSFLMSPCTQHLVIQSQGLAAPDSPSHSAVGASSLEPATQQLQTPAGTPPRQALKEVPQGACLPGFGS